MNTAEKLKGQTFLTPSLVKRAAEKSGSFRSPFVYKMGDMAGLPKGKLPTFEWLRNAGHVIVLDQTNPVYINDPEGVVKRAGIRLNTASPDPLCVGQLTLLPSDKLLAMDFIGWADRQSLTEAFCLMKAHVVPSILASIGMKAIEQGQSYDYDQLGLGSGFKFIIHAVPVSLTRTDYPQYKKGAGAYTDLRDDFYLNRSLYDARILAERQMYSWCRSFGISPIEQ